MASDRAAKRRTFMKTARFASLVRACGEPEVHLALAPSGKDSTLQKSAKANHVLTVFQEAVGNKADHGEVGFQPGKARQFLIFPKSLRAYAGRTIVGINYDLIKQAELAPMAKKATQPAATPGKQQTQKKATPPSKAKVRSKSPKSQAHAHKAAKKKTPSKILPFPKQEPSASSLTRSIRKALDLLEDGKAVAAFNVLKEAIGEQ